MASTDSEISSVLRWLRSDGAQGAPTDALPAPGSDECVKECRKREALDAAPASAGATGPSTEFVEQAARRLGIASAVLAGALSAQVLLELALFELLRWPAPMHLGLIRAAQVSLIVLSIVVFALSRASRVPGTAKLTLGLVYEVIGAFGVALPGYYCPQAAAHFDLGHVSWVCIWITFFPLVVPAPLPRAALAALLAASMGPLVLTLLRAPGTELPPTQTLVEAFAPPYLCAAISLAPAWVMHELGRQVSQARRAAKRLGSYQLVERLGKGGMGEVWRAEHSMLARPAAVKLISAELLGAAGDAEEQRTVLARFEREARATAALRSPHTVSLYDFGVADDGAFYYVMELLEGLDLETLVERFGPVPATRAVHLLAQACDSLAEAHATGLVHRDIKPANIYACRLGLEVDFVKVLDFGLVAGAKFARAPGNARLTGQGLILGTPAFMAPEMVSEGDVDLRADVYALGCVAYWLLTGRHVFEADKPMQIMIDHAKTAPVPPSRRYDKPIPPKLEEVVMACLEKSPAARPQDALELERRLLAALDGASWSADDARRWWEETLPALAAPVGPNDPTRTPRRGAVETVTKVPV
jgi:eukaryotic-like serine/threonine-protein kinase